MFPLVTKALILQLVKHKLNFMHMNHPIDIPYARDFVELVPKNETIMNEFHFWNGVVEPGLEST